MERLMKPIPNSRVSSPNLSDDGLAGAGGINSNTFILSSFIVTGIRTVVGASLRINLLYVSPPTRSRHSLPALGPKAFAVNTMVNIFGNDSVKVKRIVFSVLASDQRPHGSGPDNPFTE